MDYYKIALDFFKQSCQVIEFNNKEEWLKLRMNGIGGSDLSGILGHSHWKKPKDIYKSKKEEIPQTSNFAIDFGNNFENIIFEAFKYKYKDYYAVLDFKNVLFKNIWNPFLQASIDGALVNKNTNKVGILEIKTVQERKGKFYDVNGNRIVPDYYFDQAIHYFNTTNVDYIIFYVLVNYENPINDRDMEFLTPRIFYKKDYKDYCNYTIEECKKFWYNNVLKNIEPNEKISFR